MEWKASLEAKASQFKKILQRNDLGFVHENLEYLLGQLGIDPTSLLD